MTIIIVGAGRVGYRLAKTLSARHDVTMIDRNPAALERVAEQADVFPLAGDAENPETYRSLWGREVDLFVAVADNDEANIIACLIADDCIKSRQKIIRLRHDFFARSSIAEKIGVTEVVYPVKRIAAALRSLMLFPKANSVKTIKDSAYKLMSIRIHHEGDALPGTLAQIESEAMRIVGIERGKSLLVPEPQTTLMPGDLLYIFGDPETVRVLCDSLDTRMPSKIRNIVIFGADTLGIEIARTLHGHDVRIKLIDENQSACEYASTVLLEKATVINARYGTQRLFHDEGLKNADMLIASTGSDEENIIKCIEGREYGIERVVAVNNEAEYYQLMHNLGIVTVRGTKVAAYHAIMERIDSSSIVIGKHFCGNSGVMYVRAVRPGSALIGRKEIRPYAHPDCLCVVQRGQTLIAFRGALKGIQAGDIILAFCLAGIEEKVKKWMHNL